MIPRTFFVRPAVRRSTELGVTALFWLAWIYLISPLLSLLLWLVGVRLFVDEMLVRGGYQALLRELWDYGLVIGLMFAGVSVWIAWNQRHYGRHNKRTQPPLAVNAAEVARHAGLTMTELGDLQGARHAVVDFDDADRLQIRHRDDGNAAGPVRAPQVTTGDREADAQSSPPNTPSSCSRLKNRL